MSEGEPLRLVVEGFPRLAGATMLDKYNHGFSTMCGHGVIGVVTIVIERGLLQVPDDSQIRLDTPAGAVRVAATRLNGRVSEVSFVGVPSFVLFPGVSLRLGTRDLNLDVAFGGSFYAIVDSEAAGVPVMAGYLPELRKLGMQIKTGLESAISVAHPDAPGPRGVYGTIFTGLPNAADADLRNVTVFADGQADRSPGGCGTAAVMSVLDAMGLLPIDRPFVHESIIGTKFIGTVEARTTVGERPAILPRISGSAWITGEHEFVLDDADSLSDGFRI